MNTNLKTVTSIFFGIILGGITLFGLYSLYTTVHEDHVVLGQIVSLINSQNQKSQTNIPIK